MCEAAKRERVRVSPLIGARAKKKSREPSFCGTHICRDTVGMTQHRGHLQPDHDADQTPASGGWGC